ncbi:hypothetical protein [Nocardioides sp. Iso805N]|uniref:hypothetical protein n=1 Tax=Nocardioides sp. Iso805N TaxID=1283287 RepID=UPI00037F3D36|nr:hypothetical protein [Nocardioides sp. Iso805N]
MRIKQVSDFVLADEADDRGVAYRVAPTGLAMRQMLNEPVGRDLPQVIAVRLDIDGWFDQVLIDENLPNDPRLELDRAIDVLTATRAALDALAGASAAMNEVEATR